MPEDFFHHFALVNHGNDPHRFLALRADQGGGVPDLQDQVRHFLEGSFAGGGGVSQMTNDDGGVTNRESDGALADRLWRSGFDVRTSHFALPMVLGDGGHGKARAASSSAFSGITPGLLTIRFSACWSFAA